jgi:hypothetical protein
VTGFLLGVGSSLAAVAVVAAVGWLLHLPRRRRLLAFFGLGNDRRVFIYASRLFVPKGTSLGPDGLPRSFEGVATPDYEAKIMRDIERFFAGFAPRIRWRGAAFLRWEDIKVETQVSPIAPEDIKRVGTLIAIGSPGYNVASGLVEERFDVPVHFAKDNRELALRVGVPLDSAAFGVVQRVVNQSTGQVAFYLAGPSIPGTTAAARYLVHGWSQLARRHRANQFYEVVKATSSDGEQYDVVTASAV